MERKDIWKLPVATGALLFGLGSTALGCAPSYKLDEAKPSKITATTFTPAHDETIDDGCGYSDKGVCYFYNSHTEHREDAWSITIEQCQSGPIRQGESDVCSTKKVPVTHESFNNLREGLVVSISGSGITVIPR